MKSGEWRVKKGMICLEGNTHRLADVGNRVHTRNDSDEDVRGNTYTQAIAWKALPWSFTIQIFSRSVLFLSLADYANLADFGAL